MKAKVKVYYTDYFQIDLTDYGHDKSISYEELSENEKNEITDHLREEIIVQIELKTVID